MPGDTLVGQFRKGQGLLVHSRDCVTLRKQRVDADQLIDVEWAADVQGIFDAGIRLLVADRRGLLADVATAIADAGANIDAVSMERPDGGDVLAMFFAVQVRIAAIWRRSCDRSSGFPRSAGCSARARKRVQHRAPARTPHHVASRSGVALILWIVRSAPLYSSSGSRRRPTTALSTP